MAVLRIAKMGNPVLLQKAVPVDDPTAPEIRRLAADFSTNCGSRCDITAGSPARRRSGM